MQFSAQPLSPTTFVPYEKWQGDFYKHLRVFKCVVEKEKVFSCVQDWCTDNRVLVVTSDALCAWTFCTIPLDDKSKEAMYFCWSGANTVGFGGMLTDMQLISFKE